ncbi:hypothetical protein CEN44_01790 [Fischerella muscicola CCMEE 5323]|uniref:Uncharacterized protein n=1 Tax=Fischerella muscicola CCMEE 5323 TaxID=2019572 RepID=A0A2N6K8I6_FISMU|nr:hypothetical protein [Fischerella muscicola]PLZ93948.1 hypothetical protein CEN44_01790 [Fischerella muscicola CCMEE 5323]
MNTSATKLTSKIFAFSHLLSIFNTTNSCVTARKLISYSDYQPLHVIDGAGLYQTTLINDNQAYLQMIDLSKIQIDQLVGEVANIGFDQGKYYHGEGNYYSLFFKMKLFSEITKEYKQLYKNQIFSIINCAFFEQYKPSTQLSFPIKVNGKIITAGNSPYGLISKPKHEFYSQVCLKALVWDKKHVYITDYEPVSGAPLNQTNVQNAIVTYQYSDHPAKVLAHNQVNRYHVIGILNRDGVNCDELLLILTVKGATLDAAAE